jgi:hypothetical protein
MIEVERSFLSQWIDDMDSLPAPRDQFLLRFTAVMTDLAAPGTMGSHPSPEQLAFLRLQPTTSRTRCANGGSCPAHLIHWRNPAKFLVSGESLRVSGLNSGDIKPTRMGLLK